MHEPARHVLTWPEQGVSMAFRCIPAGTFLMGSRGYYTREEPIHSVTLSEFWLAETPVTQAQFALWTEAEKIDHKNHFEGRPDHPAENMDWHQAENFCDWLTKTKSAEFPAADWTAALPTEAQWEYACRAKTVTEYHSGDGEAALATAGWYGRNSDSTKPVAGKQANDFGLYDMHGNVLEWCRDHFAGNAYRRRIQGVCDPFVDDGVYRAVRGGSWFVSARLVRSAYRYAVGPDDRSIYLGFRCALVHRPAASRGAEEEREPGRRSDRGTRE